MVMNDVTYRKVIGKATRSKLNGMRVKGILFNNTS